MDSVLQRGLNVTAAVAVSDHLLRTVDLPRLAAKGENLLC
jgi:hypothetical protein